MYNVMTTPILCFLLAFTITYICVLFLFHVVHISFLFFSLVLKFVFKIFIFYSLYEIVSTILITSNCNFSLLFLSKHSSQPSNYHTVVDVSLW